jgi:hypothetical protein
MNPDEITALTAENATMRAALSDPRVARALADIRLTEDTAVLRISTHRSRDRLIARLAVLADGQRHAVGHPQIDRLLHRLGVAGGTHPDLIRKVEDPTITGNPSTARVLARLTAP